MLCKYCKYELDGEDILESLSNHPVYSNYTPQQLEETARMYGWTPENRKCFKNEIVTWVEFVERHYHVNVTKKLTKNDCKINKYTSRPVKLVIGTMVDGYWNLSELIENEVRFRDVPLDYVKNTIISVSTPQGMTDRDINILNNACDLGVTGSDGEGWGLCSFEGFGSGKPHLSSWWVS